MEFASGQAVSTLTLTVRDDDVAELQEVTYVQLTQIVETGTSLPGRGAVIGRTLGFYLLKQKLKMIFCTVLFC